MMAKDSKVPMKVSRNTRTGMPYQCGVRDGCASGRFDMDISATALVEDCEFKSWVGREQLRDFSQTFGERRWRQQRIITLSQIVIVHIEVKREQVNRNRVGKRRFQIFGLVALGVRAVRGRELARLPGIERGFAFDTGFNLLPCDRAEVAGDSRALDQGMTYVDIELEGHGKFVVHQARGNED